jgi:hypothetical protein
MRRWKGPECNNGIRDRGLKQKLQSNKRIKDLGGRLSPCPRNERICSWTEQVDHRQREDREAKGRILRHIGKIKDWTL